MYKVFPHKKAVKYYESLDEKTPLNILICSPSSGVLLIASIALSDIF